MRRIDREWIAAAVGIGGMPMTWIIFSREEKSGANGWSDVGARRCAKDGSASTSGVA